MELRNPGLVLGKRISGVQNNSASLRIPESHKPPSDHHTCTCSIEMTHGLYEVSQEPRPGLVVSVAQVAAGIEIMFLTEQHLLAHVLLVDVSMPGDKGNLS